MGSHAYGMSNEDSDYDIYGFAIPPKDYIFPNNLIKGFDPEIEFEQYQQHHIIDEDKDKEYDVTVYNIVNYFKLLMGNNPNIIDSIFTPQNCVVYINQIGNLVRENRKLFLNKKSWFTFKGYAYSQYDKIMNKKPEGKRVALVEKFGYDVKYASHLVRLLNEIEMILVEYDLDLQRNNDQLKAIRRGEWKLEDLEKYFHEKARILEKQYAESKLPDKPDKEKIRELLIQCLEHHYGSLDKFVDKTSIAERKLREIAEIVNNGTF